jgi:hypothetical protein
MRFREEWGYRVNWISHSLADRPDEEKKTETTMFCW